MLRTLESIEKGKGTLLLFKLEQRTLIGWFFDFSGIQLIDYFQKPRHPEKI